MWNGTRKTIIKGDFQTKSKKWETLKFSKKNKV